MVAVPAVTVDPLFTSLASVTVEVFTVPAVRLDPLFKSLASVTVEVCTDPAVRLESFVRPLFLFSEDTELVLVEAPLKLLAFVAVESEFVVVEPSGFVTVFVVDEATDWFRDLVSEVSVAAPCKAVAVWLEFAVSVAD